MASAACVAAPVTHLVSVEVIEGLVSAVRMWTSVAVWGIEAVTNVPVEVGGAGDPRPGSDEPGHFDNRFDPHHGYAGPHPARGDKPFNHFHGNEMRDGRGHAGGGGHR